MLFNIYNSDIPNTMSTQYGDADDLALLFSHKCWNEVEEVLSLDMQRIADYLSAWRLRLSTAKTSYTAFHLNNKEPSRKLAVNAINALAPSSVYSPLPSCIYPCLLSCICVFLITAMHV